ncbi:unnamed protein product [Phytophthora lilii]|uniref:Unnamed protein product n=1 Tax=Phytophthora lilii TaxID=2077276 RepID=A0A9W6XAF6_9STRA|nr:unnamed protein product [Phytophthora lilii]
MNSIECSSHRGQQLQLNPRVNLMMIQAGTFDCNARRKLSQRKTNRSRVSGRRALVPSQIDSPIGLPDTNLAGSDAYKASQLEHCSLDELFVQQTPVLHDASQGGSLTAQEGDASTTRSASPTSSEDSTVALREEVQKLHVDLQSLLLLSQTVLERNGQLVPQPGNVWKDIAARQLERRQKSEELNGKVRDMLQIQLHEARKF